MVDPINPWVDAEAVRKLAESLLMPLPGAEETPAEVCFGDGFVGFVGPELAVMAPPGAVVSRLPAEPDPAMLQQLQEQARQSLAGARHRAETGGLLERTPSPTLVAEAVPEPVPIEDPTPPAPPLAENPADPVLPSAPTPTESVQVETAEPPPVPEPPASAPPQPAEPPSQPAEVPVPAPLATSRAPFVERLHAYGQWLQGAVQAKAFFVSDRDGNVLMDQVRSPKLLQVARTLAQASQTANRHAGGAAVGSLHVKLGEASILEVLPIETGYGPLILGIVVPSVVSSPAIQVITRSLQQVVDGHPS